MTFSSLARKLKAGIALAGLLAFASLGLDAQEKAQPKDDKVAAPKSSVEVSGYTRPGNPEDKFNAEGDLIRRLSFEPEQLKKFKIMGGTVYFAVFKNTGAVEGDTFGTGMENIDARFEAGRSFKDSMSPRYDKKARYLYLYQVVNDRGIDPKVLQVKGEKGGGIKLLPFDGKPAAKVPVTDDIASFALKLLVSPEYITSWGHFRDASFAANVVDVDGAGVRQVVDDGKKKADKEIRLAFSHLPAIVTKIADPAYSRRARSHSLGDLNTGFGVAKGSLNLTQSKAYGDLKNVVGQLDKSQVALVGFGQGLLRATDSAKEPDYVQLMYGASDERLTMPVVPSAALEAFDEEVTRAIFRVDWRNANQLKQGYRSVVFGFTSDQPPASAPIRIDTPNAAAVSQTMQLANYFADDVVARSSADATGIALTAGGANAAGMALALGTSLGIASTPQPAGAPPAPAGFAGITGGFGGLGGSTGGGGGGGFGVPSLTGAFNRPSGVVGGGGGIGGGTGGGTGDGGGTGQGGGTGASDQSQQGAQNITLNNNFKQSLNNQQQQNQNQDQFQFQNQHQNQNQHQRGHGHGHRNRHGHGGHVIPAPASLLLGLLGLPGLWFLRRRKPADEQAA
jgi:hypothetical protein